MLATLELWLLLSKDYRLLKKSVEVNVKSKQAGIILRIK